MKRKKISVALILCIFVTTCLAFAPKNVKAASGYKSVYVITSITESSGATLSKVSYNSNGLINEVVPGSGETPMRGDGKWKYNKKNQVTAIGFNKIKYKKDGRLNKILTFGDNKDYSKAVYDNKGRIIGLNRMYNGNPTAHDNLKYNSTYSI